MRSVITTVVPVPGVCATRTPTTTTTTHANTTRRWNTRRTCTPTTMSTSTPSTTTSTPRGDRSRGDGGRGRTSEGSSFRHRRCRRGRWAPARIVASLACWIVGRWTRPGMKIAAIIHGNQSCFARLVLFPGSRRKKGPQKNCTINTKLEGNRAPLILFFQLIITLALDWRR